MYTYMTKVSNVGTTCTCNNYYAFCTSHILWSANHRFWDELMLRATKKITNIKRRRLEDAIIILMSRPKTVVFGAEFFFYRIWLFIYFF